MAIQRLSSVLLFLLAVSVFEVANGQGLKLGFYRKTCPGAEAIVKKTTASFISRAPTLAAALLRMHFHDCFVRGCDASVLLNSTSTNHGEKDSLANRSVRGYHVIDAAKSALEKKCPGVVSCADTLALVARDAVSVLMYRAHWDVPLGRRDGRVSIVSEPLAFLPPPSANISTLISMFAVKGFSAKDLVVLQGAHTIGISHCTSFSNRLYNFTGVGDTDPSLDPNYIVQLKKKCKPADTTTTVEMDPGSSRTFDEDYYTLVSKRRGLFECDAALLNNDQTRAYIKFQAKTHGSTFFKDFAKSMEKLGKLDVLTGNSGEIRRQCALVN